MRIFCKYKVTCLTSASTDNICVSVFHLCHLVVLDKISVGLETFRMNIWRFVNILIVVLNLEKFEFSFSKINFLNLTLIILLKFFSIFWLEFNSIIRKELNCILINYLLLETLNYGTLALKQNQTSRLKSKFTQKCKTWRPIRTAIMSHIYRKQNVCSITYMHVYTE